MKIDKVSTGGSYLVLKGSTPITGDRRVSDAPAKSLGEAPPIQLSLGEIGDLASFFAPTGLVGRLAKRLNHLKKKKCRVVPAKGTVACIDDEDTVFLGVEFLSRHFKDEETLAGVLAHEWGHSSAHKPTSDEIQKLNWDQIFEMRRAHETLADEISGRLLFMMGYTPEGLIRFLTSGKDTHNLKYHSPEVRAQIVRYGFQAEKRKGELAKEIFSGSSYKNDYQSTLLDIA